MDLDELRRLAGINTFKGLTPYEGSNISVTGNEKGQLMKNVDKTDLGVLESKKNKPG